MAAARERIHIVEAPEYGRSQFGDIARACHIFADPVNMHDIRFEPIHGLYQRSVPDKHIAEHFPGLVLPVDIFCSDKEKKSA
jgi:hypothetical protein